MRTSAVISCRVDRRAGRAVSLYWRQRWDGGSRRLSMLLSSDPLGAKPGQAPLKTLAAGVSCRFRCDRGRYARAGVRSLCTPSRPRPPPGTAGGPARRTVITWAAGWLRVACACRAFMRSSAGQGILSRPCLPRCRRTLIPPAGRPARGDTWKGSAWRPGMSAAARPPPAAADGSFPPDRSGLTAGADARQGLVSPARTRRFHSWLIQAAL